MAAITSAGSGNWNSTTPNSPWPSGVVPISGDTVTIGNGHTITVPSGYTAVCGTSPTSDAGAVALQCASASGTGILIVNGTFKWQGPVRQANATWTVGAGGTLTYDASIAATPASALYSWQISEASSQANAKLVFSGSSGSHCTVNSVGNVQSGGFGNSGTAWVDGGRIEATYADFSYQGAATTSGNFVVTRLSSAINLTFDHCTLDNCGQIQITQLGATSNLWLRNTKVTNPANTNFAVQITAGAVLTSGTRDVKFCDIAGVFYVLCSSITDSGITFKHSITRPYSITASSVHESVNFTSGNKAAAWDQNLAFLTANNISADPTIRVPAITCTNTYVFRMGNPSMSNAHPVYFNTAQGDISITGWIGHYTGTDNNSDWFEYSGSDAAVARALNITNTLFLAGASGGVLGSLYNNSSGSTQPKTVLTFDHNTVIGGGESGANVYGIGSEAAAHCLIAGSVASIRSNIKYAAASTTGWIANSQTFGGNPCTDANAISVADYQCVFNLTTSIYAGSPSGQFAGAPGSHDITADPQFVDPTRSILNFDQGYLGQSVATAWANSTAYNVGDLVSTSVSTFFNSAVYNYRCISAHTSATATDKPGSGTAWVAKWEPASIKLISDDLMAGTTYSGGTNSLIGELVAWTKAGYAPRNVAIKNAGHDSVTIGAVEGAFGSGSLILKRRRLVL